MRLGSSKGQAKTGRCGPCLLEQRCSKPTFTHSEILSFVRACIDRLLFSPRRTLRGMFQRQSPSQEKCGACVLGSCAFASAPPKHVGHPVPHVGHSVPLDRRTAAFNWVVVRRPPQFSRPCAVLAPLLSDTYCVVRAQCLCHGTAGCLLVPTARRWSCRSRSGRCRLIFVWRRLDCARASVL